MFLLDELTQMINRGRPDEVEHSFASYVRDHLGEVGVLTIHELAQRCSLSAPTVSRLIARLGFESYRDFRETCRSLAMEVGARFSGEQETPGPQKLASLGHIEVAELVALGVAAAAARVTERDLELFLSYLRPGHTVALVGMTNMQSVAFGIQGNLHFRPDYHALVPRSWDTLAALDHQDSVIVLSTHGNLFDDTDVIDALRRCKAPKLLVTTSYFHRSTKDFDHVIKLAVRSDVYMVCNHAIGLFVDLALNHGGLYD